MAIANYLATSPELGRVYLSPLDVVLSPHDVAELTAEDGDGLTSPLLPGFSLALSAFFAPDL